MVSHKSNRFSSLAISHRSFRVRLGALVAGGALVLGAAGCGTSESDAGKDPETAPLLFTLTSGGSRVKAAPSGEEGYRLLLDHVDEHSVWFTDRPDRLSGVFLTSNLVANWAAFGFDETPPNVALVTHDGAGLAETAVVTLSKPQYDTTYKVMTADITFVSADQDFTPSPGGEVDLGQMSLFIDDAEVELPSGGSGPSTGSLDWSYHSIIPSDTSRGGYVAKVKLDPSQVNAGDNLIYSIPAEALVSEFSEHHLNQINDGVSLIGQTTVADSP